MQNEFSPEFLLNMVLGAGTFDRPLGVADGGA